MSEPKYTEEDAIIDRLKYKTLQDQRMAALKRFIVEKIKRQRLNELRKLEDKEQK